MAKVELRNCLKRGSSRAPKVDSAGIRGPKQAERCLLGVPRGHVSCTYGTFQTVSLRGWVNKGLASPGRRSSLGRRPVLRSHLGWLLFYVYLEAAVTAGAAFTLGASPPDCALFIPRLR